VGVSTGGLGSLEAGGSGWGRAVGGEETACSPDEDGRVARCARLASSFWCQLCRMSRQPSIQRALQARLRMANRGFTWLGSKPHPRLFQTTLHDQFMSTLHRSTANGIALRPKTRIPDHLPPLPRDAYRLLSNVSTASRQGL